ncbi:MAG: hypothetical protein HZC47_09480 [Methanobacterium sp.]|uniref:hypothetical protein n=1 Tax=Methanobacterium sp. TaxID=2164 RepID=UPI003D650FBB|nr:hypothetical protein [Methanobacterium sp.]
MEMKYIIGIIVALVLVGGVVGCNYVINNPGKAPETVQAPTTTESAVTTTNVTNSVSNDTPKAEATTKTVKQTCTKCSGKGYFTCSACSGSGYKIVKCQDCGGDGDKPPVEGMVTILCHPCPTCGATGNIKSACASCGGDGKVLCSFCSGKGYKMVTVTP